MYTIKWYIYCSIPAHSVKSHQLNRMLVSFLWIQLFFSFFFYLFKGWALHLARYCMQWMHCYTHTHAFILHIVDDYEFQTLHLNHLGVRFLFQFHSFSIVSTSLKTFTFAHLKWWIRIYFNCSIRCEISSILVLLCYVIHQHKWIAHNAFSVMYIHFLILLPAVASPRKQQDVV